jgi:hypothetical protein
VLPAQTVAAVGWPLIEGVMFTVSPTREDVTDEGTHVPLTTQSKPDPGEAESPIAVAVITRLAVVAPL